MLVPSLPKVVNAADVAPERLAGNTTLTEQQKIAEASRQFEAILLRQILDSTQKPVIPSKFADNSTAASIYRDMITNQLADSISKSGAFGLAETFEQQLSRPAPQPDAPALPRADHSPKPRP
jgi:flagellar protein FlgJ